MPAGEGDASPPAAHAAPSGPPLRRRIASVLGRTAALVLLHLGIHSAPAPALGAQEAEAPARTLRVFLDCQTFNCDSREFRTEIRFVDWVLERTASDVHVIMTSQDLGGGGQEYVFDFIGRDGLSNEELRLTHPASATDTQEEVLTALTRVLRAGLASYMTRAGLWDRLSIRAADTGGDERPEAVVTPEEDPWNYWVFEASVDGEIDGEELQSSRELGASFGANRTTEDWKLDLNLRGSFDRREVELNDERTFVNRTDEWDAGALAVRSVSPHWSTGTGVEVTTSTRLNRDFSARTALALEWSYFPYEEANRRQLVVHYQLGVAQVGYEERTIFGELEETLGDQRLTAIYDTRQPWGEAAFSARYSSFLHDLSKYSVSLNAELSLRLFRGLELDMNGGWERIRDQIYLPAEDLTDEEILVQRRELATGYEYGLGIGISYRFGSVFNNVVNNRFPWQVLF